MYINCCEHVIFETIFQNEFDIHLFVVGFTKLSIGYVKSTYLTPSHEWCLLFLCYFRIRQ